MCNIIENCCSLLYCILLYLLYNCLYNTLSAVEAYILYSKSLCNFDKVGELVPTGCFARVSYKETCSLRGAALGRYQLVDSRACSLSGACGGR